ncbi:MAG: hypothetical protein ACRD13_10285 [Terriglobales bacterium]
MTIVADIGAGIDLLELARQLAAGAPVEVKVSAVIPVVVTVAGKQVFNTTLHVDEEKS